MFDHLLSALRDTLRPHFNLRKTRLEAMAAIMFGLVNCRTVNLTHLAAHLPGKALYNSKYRRLQHFFKKVHFDQPVNRHSTMTHYQRPTVTQLQEGGTGGEVSEILFFSAKSKRHPSLIYSMQIIPVCLSIVARRKGVSATRRGGLNWTPISLLVGHPCKLFHRSAGCCRFHHAFAQSEGSKTSRSGPDQLETRESPH